jgi:hypothetical protein
MQETHTPDGFRQPFANESYDARLSWLLKENEREANRLRLFRNFQEEEELLLMRRPIPTQKAYALFGLLLGALPPLVIFWKIIGLVLMASGLLLLLLIMSAICCFVGKRMGALMGRWMENENSASWTCRFFASLLAGMGWGLVTGAAGGLPAFGIGAVYGAVCAVPVGTLAFPLFTLLHGPLARGGMIDARHFWPLACGIVMVISALILGM